jgi:hypothetical protein
MAGFFRSMRESLRLEGAFSAASKSNHALAIAKAERTIDQLGDNIEARLLLGHCYSKVKNPELSINSFRVADKMLMESKKLSEDDVAYLREYIRQHFETDRKPYFDSKERLTKVTLWYRKQFPLIPSALT